MKIEVLKDNLFKNHYSAAIENNKTSKESEIIKIYELLDPIGYGKTPLAALESLVHKLEELEN